MNDSLEKEVYFQLIQELENNHYGGSIYNKDDNDYLYFSS